MSEMYCSPPHLTVAILGAQSEITTFARMCEVAQGLGCDPVNMVEVAPKGRDFELLCDLNDVMTLMVVSPTRRAELVAGRDRGLRTIRARYSHRRFGKVIVHYELRRGPGRHPVGITVSAGALGYPDDLWSAEMRRSAYAIDAWTRDVLQAAASKCDPLYGAIGVEFSLPSVHDLIEGESALPIDLFVSRRLLDRDPRLGPRLREAFAGAEISNWNEGVFHSGWAPQNAGGTLVRDSTFTRRAAGRALAGALRKYAQADS